MVETDCPYLTPHPHRGKRNEPMYIVHTLEKLAQLHDITAEELKKQLKENYLKLFS